MISENKKEKINGGMVHVWSHGPPTLILFVLLILRKKIKIVKFMESSIRVGRLKRGYHGL
jgi:hypothetical protein